jgi:predicted DNA-binding protein
MIVFQKPTSDKGPKKLKSFRLDGDDRLRLRDLAQITELSQGEIVRQLIKQAYEEMRAKKPARRASPRAEAS